MESKSNALIVQIKEIRKRHKITYNEIMDALTSDGVSAVSLTTVRRVCAVGSEARASSFSFEETLLPIAEAVKHIAGNSTESRCVEEIKAYLAEISRNFESQIALLSGQIAEKDALINRLMERLGQKDDIISQFIIDLRQKDEIISRLSG